MKRILVILALCFAVCIMHAGNYTQAGYIKEKSSDIHQGTKVEGVMIKVRNRKATFFSGQGGLFTLDGLDRVFSFEEITHPDYILVDDEDLVWKREISKEPIKILMVSPKAFIEEAKRYYEPMLAEVKKNNSKLKIDNEKLLEQLQKKSERLAKIDFDELSEIDKRVRECLLKGDFQKADSLILSKGSIEERMNYGNRAVASIVNDFKILSDNALIKFEIDKSIEYLENIISIDSDNIPILLELGNMYCQYKSDIASGQVYINQAIFFSKKLSKDSPTELAESYSYLGFSYAYNRNYKECINSLRKCLALYDVPNVPEFSDLSMKIDSVSKGTFPLVTHKDSTIVSEAYTMSSIIYSSLGKFRLAFDIRKLRDVVVNETDDAELLFSQIITEAIQNFQVGLYHATIKDLSELMDALSEIEFSDYHVPVCFLLAGSYSQINKLDSVYYYSDKIINYYKDNKQKYYDQYYLGAWTIKTKALIMEEKYDEVLSCFNVVEKEIDLNSVPYKDYVCSLYSNKGLAHLGKEDYDTALCELLKANKILEELVELGNAVTDLNVLINANLSIIYEKQNQLENAKMYIYRAFNQAKALYKDIGLEHPFFYWVVDQMYLLEITCDLFSDALQTAIYGYKVLDDEKDKYRKRVDDCYKLANKSKSFRKNKEYKELLSKYKEFVRAESYSK